MRSRDCCDGIPRSPARERTLELGRNRPDARRVGTRDAAGVRLGRRRAGSSGRPARAALRGACSRLRGCPGPGPVRPGHVPGIRLWTLRRSPDRLAGTLGRNPARACPLGRAPRARNRTARAASGAAHRDRRRRLRRALGPDHRGCYERRRGTNSARAGRDALRGVRPGRTASGSPGTRDRDFLLSSLERRGRRTGHVPERLLRRRDEGSGTRASHAARLRLPPQRRGALSLDATEPSVDPDVSRARSLAAGRSLESCCDATIDNERTRPRGLPGLVADVLTTEPVLPANPVRLPVPDPRSPARPRPRRRRGSQGARSPTRCPHDARDGLVPPGSLDREALDLR